MVSTDACSAGVVPIDEAHHAPQVIHPVTGALTTLGDAPSTSVPVASRVTLASDGVLAAGKNETTAYNTAGQVVGTFDSGWELDKAPTTDRDLPSVDDVGAFLTKGTTRWTSGALERPYSKDDNGYLLSLTLRNGKNLTLNPGESFREARGDEGWSVAEVRASSDGKALFVQCLPSTPTGPFFSGLEREMTYVSPELDEATNLTWIFDDLPVGARSGEVIAVTPRTP